MEVESTLSSYRIFNAVAEAGNISKAAKELFISQPAISKAVSKLEQSLSVKLFTRNSRGVKLTEEGALLYEYTCSAFESLRQGEESIRKIHSLGIGHIKIGVSTTLCKYLLLPYLQSFIHAYPHVKITIECRSTFETLAQLEEGKLDIGLIGKPSQAKTVDFFPLKNIQDTFVASPTYLENLKEREPSILGAPRELFERANLMLLDEKNITRLYIEDYFAKHNIRTGQVLEVSNMDLLIEFAKIGLGIGCVIREFVEKELENGTLEELPPIHPLAKRTVGFSYNKNAAQNDSVKRFINFYKGENHL
ncbi:MAG: LysR family transcriptional regulator [Lachnospiraceae bacterium]|nr:LysR family transcriptional regulator [Lachnospiraceae bacterium]